MTKKELRQLKQDAQEAMKKYGIVVYQKNMELLECGTHVEEINFSTGDSIKIRITDYVMFKDMKTGKEWQCYYGEKHYNHELSTLWEVIEYTA